MKKLYIISGPDRVGKSTLQMDLSRAKSSLGLDVLTEHFSEPPLDQSDIFERYRVSIEQFLNSEEDVLIWDRSYVCAHILERFRENSHSYIGDLIAFEIWLAKKEELLVEHLGVLMPWFSVAHLHLEELEKLYPEASPWFISGKMLSRSSEHQFYISELLDFYQNLTMFPSKVLNGREEVYLFLESIINNGK